MTRTGDTSVAHSAVWTVNGAAVTGADFVGGVLPSGTVSFAAGETSKIITVNAAGDRALEDDEAFTVTLSNPSTGATIATATATGTIRNDDATLTAALTTDTGSSANDGITANAAVNGQLSVFGGAVETFRAGLDGMPLAGYTNVVATLQPDGKFQITAAQLNQMAGGTLADGPHVLHLVATDAGGHSLATDVAFTLKATAPAEPVFNLAATDQTGTPASPQASSSSVSLVGQTEAGAALSLTVGGQPVASTIASNAGAFQFANVALALGDNAASVTATDLAGNTSSFALVITRVAQSAQANAVVSWNTTLLEAIRLDSSTPPYASRAMAMESLAVYDVLNAINGTPGYLVKTSAPAGASVDAAIAQAAHDILVYLYPGQSASLDAKLATALAAVASGHGKTDGIALGAAVATQVIALRSTDGWNDFVTYDGSTAVGQWRPTAPMYDVAMLPQWADLTPFALTTPEQFVPGAPPALTSQTYATDLNETASLGSATSASRTAEQTQIARFWAMGPGTYTPSGSWSQTAGQIALAEGLSLTQTARLMAMLGVAEADAGITAWNTKYEYGLWRPDTAIQNADLDNNADTTADPDWKPLIISPPFPEYVSGHSTYSAAAAGILTSFFGENYAFSATSTGLPGVTRTFTSFDQAAEEAGRSRIYGGIHFNFSNLAGLAAGHSIADWVLQSFDLAQDVTPPKVQIDQNSDIVTNQAFTLTGHVTDNLSGVDSLLASIDNGVAVPVVVAQDGSFSLPVALALDGTADGTHTISLVARDAAGNQNLPTGFSFTLDSRAPTIALGADSIQDGGTLVQGVRLVGTADPVGSSLALLTYRLDDGAAMPMTFGLAGDFDQALNLAALETGPHTLTITARDRAGNQTTTTLDLDMPALAALTVTGITPTDGAGDVGVTFRPKVTFSRAVNIATLTADSFFATSSAGDKLAATIVPTMDGMAAWLFFDNAMPSAATVTLHVVGGMIRGAADGSFLDAAGTGSPSTLTSSFTTVSTTVVPGTVLQGKVLDPGPDLQPMTFDDVRAGPDQILHTTDDVYLRPLEHVKVYILGRESEAVFTDAQGNFTLTNVPTGDVKVAVDGRTATNAPSGFYFPEMVMASNIKPGIVNTLMGSMGTNDEQSANAQDPAVYLPRVLSLVLTDISNTDPTTVTAPLGSGSGSGSQLTADQIGQLSLTVQPGSLVDENGNPLTNAQIGISPVPASLVRDMLPPGLLQHTFDITIQAPDTAVFTTPAVLTMPNVFNAAPGTKLNVLSFDHTTGKLVINGTATVSADGLTVTTDPDSGVSAPGWHGLTPPSVDVPAKILEAPPEYRKKLVDLGFDFADLVADVPRLALPLIAGIEAGLAGALLGPGGAVIGFNLGFTIVESAASKTDLLRDAVKGAGKAVVGGIAGMLPPEEIKKNIQKELVDVGKTTTINKTLVQINPYASYSYAWYQAIEHARNVGEGLGKVLNPPGVDPDYTASYLELVEEFGWDPPTLEQINDFNLLIGVIPAANDALPPPTVKLYNIVKAYVQITSILESNEVDLDAILSIQESLAYINSNLDIIGNYQGAMRDYVDGLQHEVAAATQLRSISNPNTSSNSTIYYNYTVGDFAVRGTSQGSNLSAVLGPNLVGTLQVYQPSTNFVGATGFATGQSGVAKNSMPIVLGSSRAADSDGDRLPDDAEDIVGTNAFKRDTNENGVDDFTELQLGLNPLGNFALPTGIFSSASLNGTSQAVAVASSIQDATRLAAYVATGAYGLGIVDVSNFSKPAVLSQLDLPGSNTDVEIDAVRGLAVIAANEAGLHIVDVSNPNAPSLVQTITFDGSATHVALRDGNAFVAIGRNVAVVDIATGEVLQTLDLGALGGALLTDLVFDRSTLFTMDSAHTLRAISGSGDLLALRGSITLSNGGGKLFVGGGVAYVGIQDTFSQGYLTVDVGSLDNLVLLSGVDGANIAGQSLAANGSGLLISTGSLAGLGFALDVSSTSDPTNTGAFLTRINLPAAPMDLALANGLAFVADGSAGLQIVNYRSFDTGGVAPTVTIALDAVDVDPVTPGVQVLEGRVFHVVPTITDDVQVRNTELLVNGQVVANDAAFPFELSGQAPTIGTGGTTMTLQVRATDTGGNSTLSAPIVVGVVPDTFAPQVSNISVTEGARLFFVRSITVTFDEPLDLSRLDVAGVSLVKKGADGLAGTADDTVVPVTLDTRSFGQVVSVRPAAYLLPGDYQLLIDPSMVSDRAGNVLSDAIVRNFTIRPASDVRATSGVPEISAAPSANPGQQIGIVVPFDPATARMTFIVSDSNGTLSTRDVAAIRTDAATGRAFFQVPLDAVTGEAEAFSQVGAAKTFFADGTFFLQIVPVVGGVDVESVSYDGTTAQVYLTGLGFIEGQDTEYRFGSTVVADPGASTGPDASYRYDPVFNRYIENGQTYVTVPLSGGISGPIVVKTAGGTSAPFSLGLTGISSVALSGTPAVAGQASANPGQAITLQGSGLSLSSDVLLRSVDYNGDTQMFLLHPTSVSADGTSAQVVVPRDASGAFDLMMLGASGQPRLQIVPVLTTFNVTGGTLQLYGSGFVEGGSTYQFAGGSVVDTVVNDGPDVTYRYDPALGQYIGNGLVDLAEPVHGLGTVSVTTAGGTSAALSLPEMRLGLGYLHDVAFDKTNDSLWVVDNGSPANINRIDATSGQVLQSFAVSDTYVIGGLQVVSQAMSLNGVSVPAGSLLLFNGYPYPNDQVTAFNPVDGTVIATLSLTQNHDLTAGLYDPESGHLFVIGNNVGRITEIDAATGAEISSFLPPFHNGVAGLALDPVTGNLWYGSNYSTELVELTRAGVEVRRVNVELQGVNDGEISGLAFDAQGGLLVASTHGVVYRVDVNFDAVQDERKPTLAQVIGVASGGTPANAGQASANVGQVIELVGTNFGPGTQVVFATRDSGGTVGQASVAPLVINADGTRLQVIVPELATTADIRVVNAGYRNLGFNSYPDAIYRQVTVNFTPASSTTVIRFADTGLQGVDDESWGLDNIKVQRGATTVFEDNFEGAAKSEWSSSAEDGNAGRGAFTRFSGRFNGEQLLTLSGLTAGQAHSLTFDLYVLDSWDGNRGPDQFEVSADGQLLMRDTFSNYVLNDVQTYNASEGRRLQIVPTLSGVTNGRPGNGNSFDLQGSGFMEGASQITIGGITLGDAYTTSDLDVFGSRNGTYRLTSPLTVEGPIRVTTEGGFAQIAGPVFAAQPTVQFSGIQASAGAGTAANGGQASANTGQSITLVGQGFTSQTLVQFTAVDDAGVVGTITRTGSAGNNGTTLTVDVPALARTGLVHVLGADTSFQLQVVPTLRSVGGTVATGNTVELEGTGLVGPELQIQIDGKGVGTFQVRTIADATTSSANDSQQIVVLTVPNGVGGGVITVSTAGGSSVLRTGVGITSVADDVPAADVGDTIALARNLGLAPDRLVVLHATVGDGAEGNKDVDMYRLDLAAGDVLAFGNPNGTPSVFTGYARIFNAAGQQLAGVGFGPGSFEAPSAGAYYLGLSGWVNTAYDPNVAGSGTAGGTGSPLIAVERRSASSSLLTGIVASAAQGTAAQGGVASANVGQTITLQGSSLLAGEQLVFTAMDGSGSLLERMVTAASVAADGLSLTVKVPNDAVTGTVRLSRDQVGLLLQIVPVLDDVAASVNQPFAGSGLTLTGSGFAEGGTTVKFGASSVADTGRFNGLDVYGVNNPNNNPTFVANGGLYLAVPEGVPTGPIRVSTVGGTSTSFNLTFTGLVAGAASGTPAVAGQASANPGQTITLQGSNLDSTTDVVFAITDSAGNRSETIVRPVTVAADRTSAEVVVPTNAVTGMVRVVGDRNATGTLLQIVPVVGGVDVESVSYDGTTAQVYLTGLGFIEGQDTEYRFGSTVVADPGASTGPDASYRYDPVFNRYIENGQTYVTVPLSGGISGPIVVKTAGGTSAPFSLGLTGISSVALSGTPAVAGQASANPGQAITLQGSGLSLSSDVLLRSVDYNGDTQMFLLHPTSVSADGTSAQVVVPRDASGAFDLMMLGASGQPRLQIVPVLTTFNVTGGTLQLYGSGFVEGGSTYQFAGGSVVDTVVNDGPDVTYRYDPALGQYIGNGLVDLAEPVHGLGTVSVTTAGGTSAALSLPEMRLGLGYLHDVAFDKTNDSLWVVDNGSPANINRIDATSGQVLQSFAVSDTYVIGGLQVVSQAMSLNGVSVPAGSLLLFNGYPYPNDQVTAFNPVDGTVIATLSLTQNHDLTAGLYDPESGHLFVIGNNVGRITEIDAATGAEISSFLPPFHNGVAGLALDPVTGNLWYGSNYSTELVELTRAGVEVRRVNVELQGVNDGEISGLAFDAQGGLLVASTHGAVYRTAV